MYNATPPGGYGQSCPGVNNYKFFSQCNASFQKEPSLCNKVSRPSGQGCVCYDTKANVVYRVCDGLKGVALLQEVINLKMAKWWRFHLVVSKGVTLYMSSRMKLPTSLTGGRCITRKYIFLGWHVHTCNVCSGMSTVLCHAVHEACWAVDLDLRSLKTASGSSRRQLQWIRQQNQKWVQ